MFRFHDFSFCFADTNVAKDDSSVLWSNVASLPLRISLISKQIKTRKESIAEFEKGNRQDLIDATKEEIEILNKYMPEQLSNEEVNKIIDEIFDEVKPTSIRDMGKIMGNANSKLKGRADMGMVSSIIKEKLNNL